MPLVRIALHAGKPERYRRAVADAVHRAMVEVIQIPADDRFQILSEHARGEIIYDASYLGIARSDDLILIQIALKRGRSAEAKQRLYARVAELLAADPGVRKQDVLITLVENEGIDWSFGDGVAQYAGK